TIFFSSVLLETKIFLRASCKKEAIRPHRERKRKGWRCDNSEGTARTCDGSATTGDRKLKMPDLALAAPSWATSQAHASCANGSTPRSPALQAQAAAR